MSTEKVSQALEYSLEEKIGALEKLLTFLGDDYQHKGADLPVDVVDKTRSVRTAISAILPDHSIPELTVKSGYAGLLSVLNAMSQYSGQDERVKVLNREFLGEMAENMERLIAGRLRSPFAFSSLNLRIQHVEKNPHRLLEETGELFHAKKLDQRGIGVLIEAISLIIGVPSGFILSGLASEQFPDGAPLSFVVFLLGLLATGGVLKGVSVGVRSLGIKKEAALDQQAKEQFNLAMAGYPVDAGLEEWNQSISSLGDIKDPRLLLEKLLCFVKVKALRDQLAAEIHQRGEAQQRVEVNVKAITEALALSLQTAREMNALPQLSDGPLPEQIEAEKEVDDPLERLRRAQRSGQSS